MREILLEFRMAARKIFLEEVWKTGLLAAPAVYSAGFTSILGCRRPKNGATFSNITINHDPSNQTAIRTMKSKNQMKTFLAIAGLAFAATVVPASAAITLLSEDWQTAGMGTGDISVSPNAPLTGWTGFSGNYTNPTMLSTPVSGNVLRDQAGFGGTYGSATNAGNAVRVRSSNGAMVNEAPLQLVTLDLTSVTFSFDLKKNTANYYQVVEFSNNIGFLTTGGTNTVVLLDTIFTPTGGTVGLWEAKSYTLVDGVGGVTFTDNSYFRIRKIYPNTPATGTGGANSTYHVYDNLLITGVPEPSTALLGALGALALLRRRLA